MTQPRTMVLYTRAEPALVERLDAEVERRREPGRSLSRSDLIRSILWSALEQAEKTRQEDAEKARNRADRLEAELRGAQIVEEMTLTANGQMTEALRWILGCVEAGEFSTEEVAKMARKGLYPGKE